MKAQDSEGEAGHDVRYWGKFQHTSMTLGRNCGNGKCRAGNYKALLSFQGFMGLQTDAEVAALVASGEGGSASQRTDSEVSKRLAGKFSPRSPRMRALNPADSGT